MPHLTIEYTNNACPTVELDQLFARMHAVLNDVGGIKKKNCKSRAVELDRFYVGDGDADAAFVHADLKFLEGRSSTLKREIGNAILTTLRECFSAAAEATDLQITVEISDITRSAYFKIPQVSLDYK
jgi:5-carboxymethyl-2-hydroxymuconate isomerase